MMPTAVLASSRSKPPSAMATILRSPRGLTTGQLLLLVSDLRGRYHRFHESSNIAGGRRPGRDIEMRIGYNTWSMATVPYQVFIPELARIGYTAIALSVVPGYGIAGKRVPNAADLAALTPADRRRIKEELEQREIELPSVVGNASVVEEDPETSRAHLQRLRDTIDFAVEVKPNGQAHLPTVNTGTGGRTDEFAAKQQVMVDRLGELAEYAARRGVTIAIEPHVGNAIDRPERAEWLIHTVNSPHVRLDLDISHFEVAAFSMEDVMRRLVPLSASMEIKDQNMKYAGEPERPGWRIA